MSDDPQVVIDTVGEFLVHALELEEASSDHYDELADSMEIHNNLKVAELFRKLGGYSRQHAKEVHHTSRPTRPGRQWLNTHFCAIDVRLVVWFSKGEPATIPSDDRQV